MSVGLNCIRSIKEKGSNKIMYYVLEIEKYYENQSLSVINVFLGRFLIAALISLNWDKPVTLCYYKLPNEAEWRGRCCTRRAEPSRSFRLLLKDASPGSVATDGTVPDEVLYLWWTWQSDTPQFVELLLLPTESKDMQTPLQQKTKKHEAFTEDSLSPQQVNSDNCNEKHSSRLL